jgi:hypothetical protein
LPGRAMYVTANERAHLRECRSSPLEPLRDTDEYLRSVRRQREWDKGQATLLS